MKKPIRYIKIENTTNQTGSYPYVYWVEIEAINSVGENVLLGKLPIKLMDGDNSIYYDPERGTDGIKNSGSNYLFSNYINFVKYDLGEIHEDLEKILIFQGYYGSKYAKVSVSVDNLTWETIFESYETITWRDSPNYYEAVVPNHIDFSTPDTTPPSFDYISDLILEHGSEFDPLHNVVALDDRDGDITEKIVVIGSVDIERAGKYLLTYIVSDFSGNTTVKERNITVLAEPIEEPEEPTPVEKPVASVVLQKGLYTSLSEEYSVYEVVPIDSEFPYVLLGELSALENFTKNDDQRFTFSIMIHGFTKGTSSIESKILENYIYEKIKHLKLQKFNVDLVDLLFNQNLKEDEEEGSIVFHSIQEFEITLSSN